MDLKKNSSNPQHSFSKPNSAQTSLISTPQGSSDIQLGDDFEAIIAEKLKSHVIKVMKDHSNRKMSSQRRATLIKFMGLDLD